MLLFILVLLVGTALAFLSQNNLMLVELHLGPYTVSDLPLFYVIMGSLVLGLFLSYLFYLVHTISTSLKLKKKNAVIKETKSELLELTKRIHQLELENEKLRHLPAEVIDENAL